MKKIYILILIVNLIEFTERNDEIKLDNELKSEYRILTKFKNLLNLIKSKYIGITKLERIKIKDESFVYLKRLIKLKKELDLIYSKYEIRKNKFFNHRYRRVLMIIRTFLNELPDYEFELNENSIYGRTKFCIFKIGELLSKIDCYICNLENYCGKFDRLKSVAKELIQILLNKHTQQTRPKRIEKKSRNNLIRMKKFGRNLAFKFNQLMNFYLHVYVQLKRSIAYISLIAHSYWLEFIGKISELFSIDKLAKLIG